MKEFMASDRAKNHILPLSKFGLMQITRQRVRPEMNLEVLEVCPSCKGTGAITPSIVLVEEIENKLEYLVRKTVFKKITIKTHDYLAGYLTKGFKSIERSWRKKYFKKLSVQPSSAYQYLEYHFFDEHDQEIFM